MPRLRLLLPAAVVVGIGLAGCDEAPQETATAPVEQTGTDHGTDATAQDAPGSTRSDLPVDDLDPHGGAGPDDDAVSYPATASVLAPECPVVPAHPMPHTVLSADVEEVDGGLECTTVIDSRGDALHLVELIAAELERAGHEQTSGGAGDTGPDAVHVMSYLLGGDELHVTVRQEGATGSLVHYVLTPARGNG